MGQMQVEEKKGEQEPIGEFQRLALPAYREASETETARQRMGAREPREYLEHNRTLAGQLLVSPVVRAYFEQHPEQLDAYRDTTDLRIFGEKQLTALRENGNLPESIDRNLRAFVQSELREKSLGEVIRSVQERFNQAESPFAKEQLLQVQDSLITAGREISRLQERQFSSFMEYVKKSGGVQALSEQASAILNDAAVKSPPGAEGQVGSWAEAAVKIAEGAQAQTQRNLFLLRSTAVGIGSAFGMVGGNSSEAERETFRSEQPEAPRKGLHDPRRDPNSLYFTSPPQLGSNNYRPRHVVEVERRSLTVETELAGHPYAGTSRHDAEVTGAEAYTASRQLQAANPGPSLWSSPEVARAQVFARRAQEEGMSIIKSELDRMSLIEIYAMGKAATQAGMGRDPDTKPFIDNLRTYYSERRSTELVERTRHRQHMGSAPTQSESRFVINSRRDGAWVQERITLSAGDATLMRELSAKGFQLVSLGDGSFGIYRNDGQGKALSTFSATASSRREVSAYVGRAVSAFLGAQR